MTRRLEILLVEDNPQDAELAILALEARNLASRLVHVIDGQAALDFLFGAGEHEERDLAEMPKVVLLDLKLPKVDGIEVLRQIRADERTKMLPVVVLTSSGQDRDMIETFSLSANSYIVKPVDFEQFSEVLGDVGDYWVKRNETPNGSL